MKSIKTQYIDLMEGRMSQHNFMRSLRMTLPQYITNVTSFKDSVKILKNKGILSEAMGGDPIEATLKSYLAKGYSYTEAIKLTAAEQGMDKEVLMSQYPQDAVDTEGYEDEGDDEEFIDMITKAEEEEAGKYTKFDDFEGRLSEAENTSLRNPNMAAKIVAQKHNAKLQTLQSDFKQFEREAIQLAGEEMLASGMDKVAIRNLLSGYGYFEDWVSDYIDTLTAELGNPEEEAPKDYEDPDMFDAYGMDASEGKLREGKKKREPKKELHPNQIHPQELRMGIKVELEHTDSLDKAKKIALDHLAENPFYYTALQLSGIESPSAPKAKAPKAAKKEKAAEAELVDKENAMKPVKGFEKAKASSNKAKKETNSGVKGVSELTHNAQSVRGLQKFAATSGKMKTVKESQLNEGGEYMFSGTLTGQETADLKKMIPGVEIEEEKLDDTYKTVISHPTYNEKTLRHAIKQVMGQLSSTDDKKDLGASFDKFKSQLESIVREVINEMYDGGSEDLAAMARSSNALRYKPETQAIAKKAAESANNKEEAASLAVKLAKAKGITDSEQITHIIDLATSKFMNEMYDGRDDMNVKNEY